MSNKVETLFIVIIITSKSDLQLSTAIANQLPDQLIFTQIPRIVLNSPQH